MAGRVEDGAAFLFLSSSWFLTFQNNYLQTEVNYLGQLHHPNLVKLIGFCSEGDNRLLVYEFLPKGSLESQLFLKSERESSSFNQSDSSCSLIFHELGADRSLSLQKDLQFCHGKLGSRLQFKLREAYPF